MAGEMNAALPADFVDFISCLNRCRVEYVLVGGYALAFHGVIRATGDIDFLYRRREDNVHRLCAALVDFGAPATVIDAAVLLAADTVTYFGTPPYRIDLLGDIDGVDFTAVWKDAVRTSVVGEDVLVISRRHLELNKSSTGRPKDAEDVRHLTRRTARKKRRP